MERGSDRLSVHRDEEMKHELQGLLRSGRSTRTGEWNDPEPTADDGPVIAGGPVAPSGASAPVEMVRLELARILGRTSFPTGPREPGGVLRQKYAPDSLVEPVERLPDDARYDSVQELAEAVPEGERPIRGAPRLPLHLPRQPAQPYAGHQEPPDRSSQRGRSWFSLRLLPEWWRLCGRYRSPWSAERGTSSGSPPFTDLPDSPGLRQPGLLLRPRRRRFPLPPIDTQTDGPHEQRDDDETADQGRHHAHGGGGSGEFDVFILGDHHGDRVPARGVADQGTDRSARSPCHIRKPAGVFMSNRPTGTRTRRTP